MPGPYFNRVVFALTMLLALAPNVWAASNANDVTGIPLPIPKDVRTASTGLYGQVPDGFNPSALPAEPQPVHVAMTPGPNTPARVNPPIKAAERKIEVPVVAIKAKSDQELMAEVQDGLAGNNSLTSRGQKVRISTFRGVVTLRGLVTDDAEKVAVERVAAAIAGAQNVKSQLYTSP